MERQVQWSINKADTGKGHFLLISQIKMAGRILSPHQKNKGWSK